MMQERDFSFEIKEHIGVISSNENGWSKELNVVSWNGQPAKFDIRDWDQDHQRMTKGVTLLDRENRIVETYAESDLYLSDSSRKVIEQAREEKRARDERRRTPRPGKRERDPEDRQEEQEEYANIAFAGSPVTEADVEAAAE